MPRLPGVNHEAAVRALQKAGFPSYGLLPITRGCFGAFVPENSAAEARKLAR